MILAWIFPLPEKTNEEKMVEVMTKYFNLINEIPYDELTIRFYDKAAVEIYYIYYNWKDAYEYINKETEIEIVIPTGGAISGIDYEAVNFNDVKDATVFFDVQPK
jgi:hypothetical protein